MHGLHRIDDEQFGADGAHLLEDALHARFAEQEHAVGGGIFGQEAVGAQFDLAFALLPAHIKDAALRHAEHRLEQERAFPDARFAAQEDQAAGHDAPAEHPVEFGVVRVEPRFFGGVNLRKWHRMRRVAVQSGLLHHGGAARRRGRSDGKFLHRVPTAARGAFAHPFRCVVSAHVADVGGFCFGHRRWCSEKSPLPPPTSER